MCAIGGILSKFDKSKIYILSDVQSHRGPDGKGFYIDESIALSHRRLSIIDLECGNQPMSDVENRAVITFNGEIYNYKELKNELEKNGFKFKTKSDTEVLLNCYLHYGEDMFYKIRGMFAFGIWDKLNNKLILARDFAGIKPIYYTILNNSLIFSSELKGILKALDFKPKINLFALIEFLKYGYIPSPLTIYENIYKLEPASFLEAFFQDDRIVLKRKNFLNSNLMKRI